MIEAIFREEEWIGLHLAIKGLFAAIILVSIWIGTTRSAPVVTGYLLGLVFLGLLGLAHYYFTASRWDLLWIKYVFFHGRHRDKSWVGAAQPVLPNDV